MNTEYIIYALMAVGFFTIYTALLHIFRKDTKKELIKKTAADVFYQQDDDVSMPAFAAFCHRLVFLTGVNSKKQKELGLKLVQAGAESPHAIHYFLFFRRIVQPLILVLGTYILISTVLSAEVQGQSKTLRYLLAVILLVIGMFGSNLYLKNGTQKRQKAITRSFPEGLDLLLVCIESGLGLDAALTRVCGELDKTHPQLAAELDKTRIELTVLSDRSQALQNLADRTGILPIKALVASLIQTEKFGTSLVETLRVLSEDQRIARLMDAENRAARIPVLITIPLIFCIMPAFMIIILGPPFIRVAEQGGIMGNADKK